MSMTFPTRVLSLNDQGPEVEWLHAYLEKYTAYEDDALRQTVSCSPAVRFLPSQRGFFDERTQHILSLFQHYHGLSEDGTLNEQTLTLMQKPRCGVPDVLREDLIKPLWLAEGGRWNTNQLKYHFNNFTGDIGQAQTMSAIREAFNRWSAVSPLTFTEVGAGAEIMIGWFQGNHGDAYPFDGPGATLAHCFYPPPPQSDQAGDIHFDDGETWAINADTDLLTVALHEIGHAIGLKHSGVSSAVMYAYYEGLKQELTDDDIQGIHAICNPRIVMITSAATGEAVDGGAPDKKAYLHPHPDPGNPWHRWQLLPVENYFMIISCGDGRALDAGATDGWMYTHPEPSPFNNWHLWKLQAVGDCVMIINRGNGRALDGGAVQKLIYTHPNPDSNNSFHRWRLR